MLKNILKIWALATFLMLVVSQQLTHLEPLVEDQKVSYSNGLYSGNCVLKDGNKECVFYLTRWIGGEDMKAGPAQYKELTDIIHDMRPNDRFILYVAGYGGRVDVYHAIERAVKTSQGHFYTIMDGDTYSAHSMILVLGERVGFTGNFKAMFHLPFYTNGKDDKPIYMCGREKDWDATDISDYNEFTTKVSPYLSTEQMVQFKQCQEVYVTAEELYSRAPLQFRPLR